MDVFKYNWTERMKTEPFVNYTLQQPRPNVWTEATHYRIWAPYTPSLRQKRKPPKGTKIVDGRYYKKKKMKNRYPDYYEKMIKPMVDKNPQELRDIKMKGTQMYTYPPESELHEYTRPQSLYNLRYASLR